MPRSELENPDSILVVEDDAKLGSQITEDLTREGFRVDWAKTGDEALERDPSRFALVILDLMLPGAHGMEVLQDFRSRSEVPILILSALRETEDQVRALGLGADDYVTKPFWPEQLVARVHARLRRPTLRTERQTKIRSLVFEPAARRLEIAGRGYALTNNELRLVQSLLREPGAVCSREELFREVFELEDASDTRRLEVLVSRLRSKLGVAGRAIATVWGAGYRLEASLLP